ncbi:hypothetical protein KGQ20_02165 [Catenulispora sp. NF23]|uniref:Uncharacterized protein n=1 Tax=Catenulispora pinistramenti TaxID=2705254 RepID=A0ABS5KJH8_9ACTN|nr:hypothetical protein [Catenulispora pinistramenti]MBS2531570.1 hypothetical protein [Catenulispora pinistramenti]MBS2546180.1 hypothetical protein [Catenulispora pinistramenti]
MPTATVRRMTELQDRLPVPRLVSEDLQTAELMCFRRSPDPFLALHGWTRATAEDIDAIDWVEFDYWEVNPIDLPLLTQVRESNDRAYKALEKLVQQFRASINRRWGDQARCLVPIGDTGQLWLALDKGWILLLTAIVDFTDPPWPAMHIVRCFLPDDRWYARWKMTDNSLWPPRPDEDDAVG